MTEEAMAMERGKRLASHHPGEGLPPVTYFLKAPSPPNGATGWASSLSHTGLGGHLPIERSNSFSVARQTLMTLLAQY